MWYIYVVCVYVPAGNTCSALLLVRSGGMELWQPHVCWVARFGSPKQVIHKYKVGFVVVLSEKVNFVITVLRQGTIH